MRKPIQRKAIVSALSLIMIMVQIQAQAIAWKLNKSFWSEEDEKIYENFVASIGNSKHSNLNRFIKDPKANPLYGDEDKRFCLYADCADLPYLIRAYVAYKLRLPFGYVSKISSRGGDQRYSRENRPEDFKDQDYFTSPQKLFSQITLINSGFFRMAANIENSDHYPVKIQPESIKPGTIYYDPDGHVAIVYKITDDGRIKMIDGHPDRSISKPWFGKKFNRGTAKNGGGFKRWRPLRYTSNGQISRSSNHNIPDYSATDQFQKNYSWKQKKHLSYYEYIRARLSKNSGKTDPLSEFAFMMTDIYEDILYRAIAVNIAIEKKINQKPHPGSLPWNIYGTDGIWEEFSTPSRDARLKVSFKDFYDQTQEMILERHSNDPAAARDLAERFLAKYELLSPGFTVDYKDSQGNKRVLSFDDVANRLFRMSFDPYHSIEFRWGGFEEELAFSPDSQKKRKFYELESRLRNQLERRYNCKTSLSMGPEKPPEIRVKAWLVAYLNGKVIAETQAKPSPINFSDVIIQAKQPDPASIQQKKLQFAAKQLATTTIEVTKEKAGTLNSAKTDGFVMYPDSYSVDDFKAGLDSILNDFAQMIREEITEAGKGVKTAEN